MASITIFVFQITVFTSLTLWLHALSPRLGLSPMLFLASGIIGVLNFIELGGLFFIVNSGWVLRPGGHIFVPVVLLIILIIYVADGTRPARVVLFGLIGINGLILVTLLFLVAYLSFPATPTHIGGLLAQPGVIDRTFLRGVIASGIAFTGNMFVIIVVYQGITNTFEGFPATLSPGIALLIALWTDSALFNLFAYVGTDNFTLTVSNDVVFKTVAGVIIAPFVGIYLTRVAPSLPAFVGGEGRNTLDILARSGGLEGRINRLEQELRVSRATYYQLTQHINAIFWLLDVQDRKLIYLSPAFERLTGIKAQQVYGKPARLLSLLHPDDREEAVDDPIRFLQHPPTDDFRVRGANGSYRWIRNRSFPISQGDSRSTMRHAGLAYDVTEQRKADEQTFALAMAQERVKLLNDFIRDASHDLKTPLSSILLKVDLLERSKKEQRPRLYQELREQAYHLTRLIDELFALSRLESDETTSVEKVGLNHIIRETAANLNSLAQSKSIQIILELDDRDSFVQGNGEQLYRLVSNLIGNALRYTTEGTVTVRAMQDAAHTILEVEDTGIGIPPEDIPHIYDRFRRATNVSQITEGTGLGLAIAKAVVDRHNGEITVESAVGEGTRFRVQLPAPEAL